MSLWLVMIVAGLATHLTRASFIILLGRRPMPSLLLRALRFVPPAVLSAIVFPELLMPSGALHISPGNLRLLAGLVAILVAWRTKNIVLTIVVGMLVLWALQFAL
ncbi:MAG: AzlD domain-containing protein [Anaerolineales bacterium]|nr:AzlD domain-containing protein [Anaerolineales bacterium]